MQKLSIPSRHTSEVQPLLHPFAPAITYPAPSSCTLLKPSTQFVRVLIAVTMAEGGPALPWAAQAAPAPVEEENDDDAPAKALSLEELALKVGTKVGEWSEFMLFTWCYNDSPVRPNRYFSYVYFSNSLSFSTVDLIRFRLRSSGKFWTQIANKTRMQSLRVRR